MLVNGKNECIRCSIDNCAYHAKSEDYCTLDQIKVGTHEKNPVKKECTANPLRTRHNSQILFPPEHTAQPHTAQYFMCKI